MRESLLKRIFKHRVFVNVAFSDTAAVRGFHVHSVSFVVAIFVIIGALLAIYSEYEQRINSEMERRGEIPNYLKQRISELESDKELQKEQIRLFAEELGVLQARLDRFDAISEKMLNDPSMVDMMEANPELGGKGDVVPPKFDHQPTIDELREQIISLQDRTDGIDTLMNASMKLMATQEIEKSQKPYYWPLLYSKGYISSTFGYRHDPFSKKKTLFHGGTDFVGPRGSTIVSAGDGVVVFSGYRYGYGISVEIRHAHGFTTRYAHMDKTLVKNGQTVKAGDFIGKLGSTGRSTGPHLHFEVLIDDTKVDPYPLVSGTKGEVETRAKQLALAGKL